MLAPHSARNPVLVAAVLGAAAVCPSAAPAVADPYHARAPIAFVIARANGARPSGDAAASSPLRCGDTLARSVRLVALANCPGGWRFVGAHGPTTPAVSVAAAEDLRSPDTRDVAAGRRMPAPPVVMRTPVVRHASGRFHWGDAALGAAATLGVWLLTVGLWTALARRQPPRKRLSVAEPR
jgi:hypothetical protein